MSIRTRIAGIYRGGRGRGGGVQVCISRKGVRVGISRASVETAKSRSI